jgi:hypothetical protein
MFVLGNLNANLCDSDDRASGHDAIIQYFSKPNLNDSDKRAAGNFVIIIPHVGQNFLCDALCTGGSIH